MGSRDRAAVRALDPFPLMWLGVNSQTQCEMWVEFVGSLLRYKGSLAV